MRGPAVRQLACEIDAALDADLDTATAQDTEAPVKPIEIGQFADG